MSAATPERVLDDLLCFDLYATSRAMTAAYRPVLAPLGLTYPQFLVLVVLARRGESSIGEVGEATRLDHGTLTPLLRRMADRALLRLDRDRADGRSVTVALTARGEELRPELERVQCHLRESVGLSERELIELQGMLRRLAAHVTVD